MVPKEINIGGAAGFSGDRPEGGLGLIQAFASAGEPAVIIFETLAERTLALAQQAKTADPNAGYEPQLTDFLKPILPSCLEHGIPVVGNFGAANPKAAAWKVMELAREKNLAGIKLAVVKGDDLLAIAPPRRIMDWMGMANPWHLWFCPWICMFRKNGHN